MVFSSSYRGGGGTDYACNKIVFYEGTNTPTTTASFGFGVAGGQLDYFSNAAHVFHTGTTGGTSFGTERMRITSTGNVGIGTATVNHKLHVGGTSFLNGTVYYGTDTWHSDVLGNKKIWYATDGHTYLLGGSGTCFTFRNAAETIIAEMYSNGIMYILGTLSQGSDSRIKTNIKDIDDDEALNLILAIEPKTYEYIDKKRGSDTVYGFIAQQVKEVIPRAIQIVSDILPNIYKVCECEGDIIYCSIPQDVSINTEIKLRDIDDKEVVHKILEIGEDYIRIDSVLEVNNVFVFGYNVDNFHRMSKEYIYTLNVCATQILSRKIEAQSVVIKSYEDRIKDLEMKVAMLLSSNTT